MPEFWNKYNPIFGVIAVMMAIPAMWWVDEFYRRGKPEWGNALFVSWGAGMILWMLYVSS